MGAAESNAGDDFHFWWAAGRALALIKPGTATQLLTVEGLALLDDPDEQYEIVDVAEYLGGASFDDATAVLISQLKYSTKHPTRAWTGAQLCRKRSRRRSDGGNDKPRSVVADLASTYKRLVTQHGRDAVLAKARIRLVSNQPADQLLDAALSAAAQWVSRRARMVRRTELYKVLTPEHTEVVKALATAVGTRLSAAEFCDFLTVLDLSALGERNREALARQVRAATTRMSPGRGSDSALRLVDLVREQAMPGSQREGISAHDVLAALGVGDRSDLYPALPHLVELPDPLPAPSAPALAHAVTAHLGGILVARGAAGAGKTTALRQVGDHLPASSIVVLYDCYGAGQYLNAGEERHTPERFVMQVTNDLAQQCGTPLLLHPPLLHEDLWRHFTRALTDAVANIDPDAVLVIAVDAADNAAVAAVERNEGSFLDGLLRVPLPQKVCVVLSARSHRVAMTGAADRPAVDIAPFDPATSALHLRRHRADITPADAAAFHERTAGNPRTQFYVLEQANRSGWNTTQLLEASRKTPDELFADIVDSALAGSPGQDGGRRWLAALLALSRPISTRTLAGVLHVDPTAVSAFAEGLTPGVEITGDRIQFRDEDFETYVRDQVAPADIIAAHARLAELLYTLREDDPDAAAHVADHQFHAGHLDDLLALVLAEDAPLGIADGFRRQQVQGRRLDLAARAAATRDDGAVAVRVAARGCDTASRLNTLSELVETNLDLVARYTDVDLLRTHALKQHSSEWLGPAHMQLAAVLARNPDRSASAREALRDADAWVDRWMALREGKASHWQLTPDDLAAAAEALYRLDGVEAAYTWLRRWRPTRFIREAAAKLAARVAGSLGPAAVLDALGTTTAPVAVHAPFLAYAASPTAPPDADWLANTVEALTRTPVRLQDAGEPWHARLLDTVLRHGSPADALALAQRWAGALPTQRWEFQNRRSHAMHRLRCHAALAALRGGSLDLDSLIPAALQPEAGEDVRRDDRRARDRAAWLEVVRPLGTMAVLAADAILGHPVSAVVVQELTTRLDELRATAGHRWFRHDASFQVWGALAAEAVTDVGADVEHLDRLVDAAPALLRADAPHLWLDVAELLAERGVHTDRAIDLCLRVATTIRTSTIPAPQRVEFLTRAADIAAPLAPELGAQLFGDAVDAATGINDDAARLLAIHADLARRATFSADQRGDVAERLVDAVEGVAPHVTDSRVVPYAQVAGAAAGLDAGVGLAAVSRWDDEDRIGWTSTLSPVLIGAVDGGVLDAAEALVFDHLLDDDSTRLRFQISAIERLLSRPGGMPAARLAVSRAVRWLRLHVAAASQPRLARTLLEWAANHGLDTAVRAELVAVTALAPPDQRRQPSAWTAALSPTGPTAELQAMLDAPRTRSWATLRDDVERLDAAHVYGETMRRFVREVASAAAPSERLDALGALGELPGRHGPDTALPVLVELVERWRDWPGVTARLAAAVPDMITRWLTDLAWRDDTDGLLMQLRALADDTTIRRAILQALPSARTALTAWGWRAIATLLGRLCPPADAAIALVGLLDDRTTASRSTDHTGDRAGQVAVAHRAPAEPLVMLLWSAFAHPRREMRWRAGHTARELCRQSDTARASEIVAALVSLVGRDSPGRYRDSALYFYRLSADAAVLTVLERLAIDRPDLLADHITTLVRIATSREQPHVQIRELARRAALADAQADPDSRVAAIEQLAWANQPTACSVDRTTNHWSDRQVSDDRRYRFDRMDTIPYWYAPLARVFGVSVDAIAERAERWILDRWGGSEDDWMTDTRELRDERSWNHMHNGHGAIPPQENLRLYFEYHAMLAAAGELLDGGHAVRVERWDDGPEDRWQSWLREHLPVTPYRWLAELRSPVPIDAELFGALPSVDEWENPDRGEFDRVLGLTDGRLPDDVLVDGHVSLHRPDGYGHTYVSSALVTPAHASDLQRALAAATYATDWKLPDDGESEFEVKHGSFVLRGWMHRVHNSPETLEEHDPYAYELRPVVPLPGRHFRETMATIPDPTGTALLGPTGSIVARGEQWSDPRTDDPHTVSSSGTRTLVERSNLLSYLKTTGTNLIVEVQLGRNGRERRGDDYNLPRSRIYLIDAEGHTTGA